MALPVLIASPVDPALAERVLGALPGIELLHAPELLPAQRFPGDITGEAGFERDEEAERRWRALLARAEVLYGVPESSGGALVAALAEAPAVRWVQARNAGAGEQLAQALEADRERMREVVVTSVSGIHAEPLAEFTLLGLLALVKGLPALQADQAARRWPTERPPMPELRGRTVVIVGLGAIGLAVARLAAAFGMRVLGVRRHPAPAEGVEAVHGPEALVDLAARADALVVTLPLTEGTRGLVSAAVIDALPEHAVVVNVGRGAVIDELALVARLEAGGLGGAALDVFTTEPLPEDSSLWGLPNVIVSPHGAALTDAEDERALEVFADNLRRYLAGEPLRNRVDPEALY